MNTSRPTENAWQKLAGLAVKAPTEMAEMPYAFASRVVSAWKADRRESTWAAFEWLTIRGLAVALVIFAGSAAFGYDAVAEAISGDSSLVGGWLDLLPVPL